MIERIIDVLDLAQCELRANYKRLGYVNSNVLRAVETLHEELTKQTGTNPLVSGSVCVCKVKHKPFELTLNECRVCKKPLY